MSACSGLEVGIRATCYCEYILTVRCESAHFSALDADYAKVDQQRPYAYTHSRNFWQQLVETPSNLQSV